MSDLDDILGVKEVKEKKIITRFKNKEDLDEFGKKLGIKLNKDLTVISYPSRAISKKTTKPTKETTPEWSYYWKDMPDFVQDEVVSYAKIDFIVREDYLDEFCEIAGIDINKDADVVLSIWYNKDKDDILFKTNYRNLGGEQNGKYPIYIISKGRWEYSSTSKYLSLMQVPHHVVVEPQEYEKYMSTIGKSKYTTILKLDMDYKEVYDSCDEVGDAKGVGKGSGPARNFSWEHSIEAGFDWHWLMDDNIESFHRLHQNHKIKSLTGSIFKETEDFVERFDNIAISGFNYSKFAKQIDKLPPYIFNTRIFSCILIRNNLPIRWRSRYNEDVDLNLRAMKMGYATCQMNAFLADKMTTQVVKGGNTDEFYKSEGTLIKSEVLKNLHPDVVTVTWKFSRWHHHADYRPFNDNKLSTKFTNKKIKQMLKDKGGPNNRGMYIIEVAKDDLKGKNREELEAIYPSDSHIPELHSEFYSKKDDDLSSSLDDLF